MERQSVRSSNLKSVGYDAGSKILEIEFLNGGLYQYRNVPTSIFTQLIAARSKGEFFNESVKEKYQYIRVKAAGSK